MAGQWGIFNLFPTFLSFDALTPAASRALVRTNLKGQEDECSECTCEGGMGTGACG